MTGFNLNKKAARMTKYGPENVDLNLTPFLLQCILSDFDNKPFSSLNYQNLMKNYSGYKNIAKRNSELKRLRKNGWLNSKCVKKDDSSKMRIYSLSKKSLDYLEAWGDFESPSGPLMKPKEKIIEIEKEVIKEIKSTESYEGVYK